MEYFRQEIEKLYPTNYSAGSYSVGAGAYGYKPTPNSIPMNTIGVPYFVSCRDKLQSVPTELLKTGMFFSHPVGANFGKAVAAFIHKIETQKLTITEITFFKHTDQQDVLWLKPSPFWLENPIKRSLFSLLLRCGIYYNTTNKDAFEVAINSQDYSRITKPAIDRFLSGYTIYSGVMPTTHIDGWHFRFITQKIENLRKLLLPSHELIAKVAYEKHTGNPENDWFLAEKELRER